jgi:adenylate cyclase
MERRLAAILLTDMVGYSRLMGLDEEGTIARQKTHREEIFDPKIFAHGGRIVKSTGDGLLIEFPSVVDAVKCAVEVQEVVAGRDANVPEDQRIQYRIGINLGDIVIDGDDILGDGVNVAARLEGLAKPGGICISRAVCEQLAGKLDVVFEDWGEQQLKNVPTPVQVWHWHADAPASVSDVVEAPLSLSGKPSVAVLPFANLSNDTEQEYFADGLTEDIITALTYWRSFPVVARNSCFAYKNKSVDIKQAGRGLGARYILEGSVRKLGERVRITVQLVDGVYGHHVWADKYDRELDDIFEVQDEIVQCIAAHIAPELSKAELKRGSQKEAKDLNAWDLVLRAMPCIRKKSKEGNAQARELFSQAISIQPDYSDAYAGLAMSFHQDILIGVAKDRAATADRALEAAKNAVECDEASSWAHHELSTAYQWLSRFDDALDEARIAVDLNPNDAYALHALGNKSDLAGDSKGISRMERAQVLNPEDASRYTHLTFLARGYVNAGKYADAANRARQAIRRQPDYAPAHYILAIALEYLGQSSEAWVALKRCDEISPGFVESRRSWEPYANPPCNERFQGALRRIND